ncbi:MAG: hypothetical protein F6K65_14715 [Moorea sp. SIO3C2]|nr:hypothetical protein [Moorena sp. SIO3C2]
MKMLELNDLDVLERLDDNDNVVGGVKGLLKASALINSFRFGYKIGTAINKATGLSNKIADAACGISGKC